uniref:Uncharacterized protein n=1 Tax=Physcomitrium patens TaxID=3218 RepID=A0A2K1L7G1_PHYPA|nr:hypothetical protein PHYPA_000403 [Physcomitrium patens]
MVQQQRERISFLGLRAFCYNESCKIFLQLVRSCLKAFSSCLTDDRSCCAASKQDWLSSLALAFGPNIGALAYYFLFRAAPGKRRLSFRRVVPLGAPSLQAVAIALAQILQLDFVQVEDFREAAQVSVIGTRN